MAMPETLIEVAVKPETPEDAATLVAAMQEIMAKDSTCAVIHAADNKEVVLKGQSEFHLEEVVTRLREVFLIKLRVGAPQVNYQRTFHRHTTIDYTYENSRGSKPQFAKIVIGFEPLPNGAGFQFEARLPENTLPQEYSQRIEDTLHTINKSGRADGFPVVDFKAILKAGCACNEASSVSAFEIATRIAFGRTIDQATVLLEPIMKIEIVAPENFIGEVIGEINSRRGQVSHAGERGDMYVVNAMVPLA
jgi:elongation factor G